uniref:Uncharacterized protein n=1 Tax=Ditylenchus dipsaci TaxID=166011 RepID=A0A915D3F8_9BILA
MDAEMNLFMFTIVLFLLAGVFIACQTIFFFKIRSMSDEQVRFVIGMQLYAQDLYVCAAPWLLFMLSGPMRKEIRRLYKINAVDVATNSWNSPQANK